MTSAKPALARLLCCHHLDDAEALPFIELTHSPGGGQRARSALRCVCPDGDLGPETPETMHRAPAAKHPEAPSVHYPSPSRNSLRA